MSLQIPREDLLSILFQLWQKNPTKSLIRDVSGTGYEASVEQFLYDILTTRERILTFLDTDIKDQLNSPDTDIFVGVLVGPGYAFAVIALALYSIGAVVVPLSLGVHPSEAKYFLQLCHTTLLLTVPTSDSHAQSISTTTNIPTLTITTTQSPRPPNVTFTLQAPSAPKLNPEKGFVLLYTSGTTGPPKGVLHSRRAAEIGLTTNIKTLGLTTADTWLHYSPVHWVGGWVSMFHSLLSGACLEFCASVFSPEWLLSQWEKKAGSNESPTAMYLVPSVLEAVGDKVEAVRRDGPPERFERILEGLGAMRVIYSGSMRVTSPLRDYWRELRGGRPLMIMYGMSEVIGFVASNDWDDWGEMPPECCGRVRENVEVRVDGEGELCIRGPSVFTRYISEDPRIMDGVFDEDGYWNSGDVGKVEGGLVYVFGRASHDVIRFAGWKLMAPEVESELAEHPLVSQAIVVGVQDSSVGERVAALVVVSGDSAESELNLSTLRKWLAIKRHMNAYKLPTVLRVVRKGLELPMTASGKIIKPKVREIFFNRGELDSSRVQTHDLSVRESDIGNRPFDWAGIQAS
ncbi:hypothetical protein ETB97_001321 [Aspergillus alliaceus]|uniref:Uncharacterized protein n=1 Tax=Petromyces alliaceus TaxID=209559 RepID=A0A8H6A301_PETAA|nr:hypothetical protein ETB97_001321 [Aspergillus burnettii]